MFSRHFIWGILYLFYLSLIHLVKHLLIKLLNRIFFALKLHNRICLHNVMLHIEKAIKHSTNCKLLNIYSRICLSQRYWVWLLGLIIKVDSNSLLLMVCFHCKNVDCHAGNFFFSSVIWDICLKYIAFR